MTRMEKIGATIEATLKANRKMELVVERSILIYELDLNNLGTRAKKVTVNRLRKVNTLIAISNRK